MTAGEVRIRNWGRVLRRVSGAYGNQVGTIGLTIGCSLIGVVLFGTIAGGMLPFVLRACNLDPASASTPAVATLVDVSGLVIYISRARMLMLEGVR